MKNHKKLSAKINLSLFSHCMDHLSALGIPTVIADFKERLIKVEICHTHTHMSHLVESAWDLYTWQFFFSH